MQKLEKKRPVRTKRFRDEASAQVKSIRTRALLMDAAVTVFSRRGIQGASISEITEVANVANGTFYYHFKDKSELVNEVGHAVAVALVRQVDEATETVTDGAERCAFATICFITLASADPEWGWLVVDALHDMDLFFEQISSGIRKDVAIGLAQARFSVEPSNLLFKCLLSVVASALRHRLENPRLEGIEIEATELILKMLGIAPRLAKSLPRKAFDRHMEQRQKTLKRPILLPPEAGVKLTEPDQIVRDRRRSGPRRAGSTPQG